MIILSYALFFMLYLVILWIIIFPIISVLHEFGHALTALALTDQDITILIGVGNKGIKLPWGRLQMVIGWCTGFVGSTIYDIEKIEPHRILWIAIAGPIVSLFLAVLFWILASIWGEIRWFDFAMKTIAYAALGQFMFTILPLRYPSWLLSYKGYTSDGWQILQLLQGKPPVT